MTLQDLFTRVLFDLKLSKNPLTAWLSAARLIAQRVRT